MALPRISRFALRKLDYFNAISPTKGKVDHIPEIPTTHTHIGCHLTHNPLGTGIPSLLLFDGRPHPKKRERWYVSLMLFKLHSNP